MDTARNTLMAIMIGALILSTGLVGGAAAQETPTTETPTATPTPTPTEQTSTPSSSSSSEESEETTLVEVDPDTRIVSASWDDGTVTMVVERSEDAEPTRDTLVVTDASIALQEYQARQIPQSRTKIGPGRHEVTFTVEERTRAAVTVGTSRGLVSLSPSDGGGWWMRSASWDDVRLAALAALLGVPGVGVGLWARVSSRSVDVEGIDLGEEGNK